MDKKLEKRVREIIERHGIKCEDGFVSVSDFRLILTNLGIEITRWGVYRWLKGGEIPEEKRKCSYKLKRKWHSIHISAVEDALRIAGIYDGACSNREASQE